MNDYSLPFDLDFIKNTAKKFPTPFIIYDEKAIKENMEYFYDSFNFKNWFKNYFAVKATPNPSLIKILKNTWSWADCSSLWELILADKLWFSWDEIMFTSNNTELQEFIYAQKLWAIINFDDITHIDYFLTWVWETPKIACCRYNPWDLKSGNEIIWNPKDAKYGMTLEQIVLAYKKLFDAWVKRFWLHTMVASNELNPDYFVETAKILFELALKISKEVWIEFEFINLWGWIWTPYKPEQTKVDLKYVWEKINELYLKYFDKNFSPKIVMECWRMITWPYWYLLTQAIHTKNTYKDYIWVDACMSSLMRPALYWAYHHITVLGKENIEKSKTYDIVWSLCENNDKFAIDRNLAEIEIWDYLVIHNSWAHGSAMWFNYNAKLRPKELLLNEKNEVVLIRRAETLDDYFATVEWINWISLK